MFWRGGEEELKVWFQVILKEISTPTDIEQVVVSFLFLKLVEMLQFTFRSLEFKLYNLAPKED